MTINRLITFPLRMFHRHPSVKRPNTFSGWCQSARNKMQAVKILCENEYEHFPDAIPLLRAALEDLSNAMAPAQADTKDATFSADDKQLFGYDDWLATKLKPQVNAYNRLVEWSNSYDRLKSIPFTQSECETMLQTLEQGFRIIEKRHRTLSASPVATAARWMKTLLQGTVLIGLIGTFSFGLIEFSIRPSADFGLSATYFSKRHFNGHPFMWTDQQIDFEWTTAPPFKTHQSFSVRWEGCLVVKNGPTHVNVQSTETPFTLWVDEEAYQIGTQSHFRNAKTDVVLASADDATATRPLANGTHYITLEVPMVTMPASIQLKWRSATLESTPIPTHALIPLGGNTDCNCSVAHHMNHPETSR